MNRQREEEEEVAVVWPSFAVCDVVADPLSDNGRVSQWWWWLWWWWWWWWWLWCRVVLRCAAAAAAAAAACAGFAEVADPTEFDNVRVYHGGHNNLREPKAVVGRPLKKHKADYVSDNLVDQVEVLRRRVSGEGQTGTL